MKYYKVFDENLKCYNGFQYEVGKTYDTGYEKDLSECDLCTNHVFHFCDSIESIVIFKKIGKNSNNRLCEVEPLGNIVSEGEAFGTNKLKVVREITGDEFDYLTGNGTHEMIMKRFHDLYDGQISEKFDRINVGCRQNFSNGNGSVISPYLWFDWCNSFQDEFAVVELNEKCNLIGTNGKIVSDQWFDYCYHFYDGCASVQLNGKWNFVDKKGKYLSEQWFDLCYDFQDEFAVVELNEKCNLIGTNGKVLSDQWFDYCSNFHEGYAIFVLKEKWNFVGTDGKVLSDQWFDECTQMCDGYAPIKMHGKWNFIGTNGKYLSDQWFDLCYEFNDRYAKVCLGDKSNFIGTDGTYISNLWFEDSESFFRGGYTEVKMEGRWNYIESVCKHKIKLTE